MVRHSLLRPAGRRPRDRRAHDARDQEPCHSTLGNTVGMMQKARLDAHNGSGGLRDKMKAVKEAVRSQYGSGSAEFQHVKGIGL